MAHLFVSYARKDSRAVARLVSDLHRTGHTTWLDKRSIRVGEHWKRAIARGVADADAFLVALSPDAVVSEWVQEELRIAHEQHRPVLPVIVAPTPAERFPRLLEEEAVNAVSLVDADYAQGLRKLLHDLRSAAAGPRIPFIVDHPRLGHFVGRNQLLRRIHGHLTEVGPGGPARVGLWGMGGVGKTQLAVEYAHRYRYYYPGGILLVDAAAPWDDELVRVALRLKLRADEHPEDRRLGLIASLAKYLDAHRDALLIFDNLRDPSELRRRPLALGLRATGWPVSLLFTTRVQPEGFPAVEVDLLPPALSAVLVTRTRDDLSPQTEGIDTICRALGHLPLALDLAAVFLARKPRAMPADYLAALKRHGLDELNLNARLAARDLEAYPVASVTPALEAQWELLETEPAGHVIRLMALAPEGARVPVARLGLLGDLQDEPGGIVTPLADAVAQARRTSLIEPLEDARVRIHPLVRDFVRRSKEAGRWTVRARANLLAAYRDVSRLEEHCAERGVAAVEADVAFTLALPEDEPREAGVVAAGTDDSLRELLRILQLEAFALESWRPRERPSLLAQQLLDTAARLRARDWVERARARLEALAQPYLELVWTTERPSSAALERTLIGHPHEVRGVAVTPDARRAVSVGIDRGVRVWDLASGHEERSLSPDSRFLSEDAFIFLLPDGSRVLAPTLDDAQEETGVALWNLESGERLKTIPHSPSVTMGPLRPRCTVFPPAGDRAYWACGGRLRVSPLDDLWNGTDLADHGADVRALGMPPDGSWILSGGEDGTLKQWEAATGRLIREFPSHRSAVRTLQIAPGADWAASTDADGLLRLWSLETGNRMGELSLGGDDRAVPVVIPAGSHVLAPKGSAIEIWTIRGERTGTLRGHAQEVTGVAVLPDGSKAISASKDGTLKVWRLDGPPTVAAEGASEEHLGEVMAIAWVRERGVVVTGSSRDRVLRVWDAAAGTPAGVLPNDRDGAPDIGHVDDIVAAEGRVRAVTSRKTLVAGSSGAFFEVHVLLRGWDLDRRTARPSYPIDYSGPEQRPVHLSRSGRSALALGKGKGEGSWIIFELDLETNAPRHHTVRSPSALRLRDVARDGRRLVLTAGAKRFEILSLDTGDVDVGGDFDRTIDAARISEDERRLLVTFAEGGAAVCDLPTSRAVLSCMDRSLRIEDVAADGGHAVTSSPDGRLQIWDLDAAACKHDIRAHTTYPDVVAIHARAAVAASVHGHWLRIWRLDTGQEAIAMATPAQVTALAVADERHLIAGTDGGGVLCLRLAGLPSAAHSQ